jgi:hypothetical protein
LVAAELSVKRWRRIAAALLIAGVSLMFPSCAATTAVGVTTTQEADKADKPLR